MNISVCVIVHLKNQHQQQTLCISPQHSAESYLFLLKLPTIWFSLLQLEGQEVARLIVGLVRLVASGANRRATVFIWKNSSVVLCSVGPLKPAEQIWNMKQTQRYSEKKMWWFHLVLMFLPCDLILLCF